jgi:hypothetical protein
MIICPGTFQSRPYKINSTHVTAAYRLSEMAGTFHGRERSTAAMRDTERLVRLGSGMANTGHARLRELRWVLPWLVLLVAVASLVRAQVDVGPTLKLDLTLWLVTSSAEEGQDELREELEIALSVEPGSLLEWHLQAENDGHEPIEGLTLELPLPAEVELVLGSVELLRLDNDQLTSLEAGFSISYSADGGETFAAGPLTVTVVTIEEGIEVEREEPLPASAYSHVRVLLEEPLEAASMVVMKVRSLVR